MKELNLYFHSFLQEQESALLSPDSLHVRGQGERGDLLRPDHDLEERDEPNLPCLFTEISGLGVVPDADLDQDDERETPLSLYRD